MKHHQDVSHQVSVRQDTFSNSRAHLIEHARTEKEIIIIFTMKSLILAQDER